MNGKIKARIKPIFSEEGIMENKKKVIEREVYRMKQIIKELAPEQLIIAEPVIESVAFQTANLQELESILNIKGFTETYQNGQNQHGIKESSESKSYINLAKTCLAYRKQLFDIVSKNVAKADQDELMMFLGMN